MEEFNDWDKWHLLFCELCVKNGFTYKIGSIEGSKGFGSDNSVYIEFGKYRAEAVGTIHLWQAAVRTFLNKTKSE